MGNMNLETKAREIRGIILDQVFAFGNGHIASAFSCTEILLYLYWRVLKVNAANPDWPDRDRLIISKGHGVSALYAILADLGFFPKKWLTAPQDGNLLGGHADWKVPGIDWSTGSLGHGLSIAAGMAQAAKMNGQNHRIFCLLGDGEIQEGSVWEAAMFAAHHSLKNLVVIVDYNRHQSCGPTGNIVNLGSVRDKFAAFGWYSSNTNGHNFQQLSSSLNCLLENKYSVPTALIAYTNKGHGVSFIENDMHFHTGIPTQDQLLRAKKELGILRTNELRLV